jgi:23S rRNA (cytosine1962-C5)-methyltransferase
MTVLRLTADAAAAVGRGHPWVFRDAVRGRAEVGAVVSLQDGRGRAVGWGLFDEGPIAVRVLGRGAPQELTRLLAMRLERADRLRFRVVGGDTDCWRVVNGPGDGLPGVVVDRYAGLAVVKLYSAAWQVHLDALVSALSKLGWVEQIYRRLGVQRVDQGSGGVALYGSEPAECMEVREHGLRLLVRPRVGQKTGLFLDQRENRKRVGELAPGRSVVNLFGYNGGFSIYAAAAGAARVVTVDVAGPALEDARAIFALNGLDPDLHGFEQADVFEYTPPGRPDLIICDPPSLTRGQKSDSAAKRAYRDLNRRVGASVSRSGLLATASCTARLAWADWERAVAEGLRDVADWAWLERAGAGPDHPVALGHSEGHYLKFAVLQRL